MGRRFLHQGLKKLERKRQRNIRPEKQNHASSKFREGLGKEKTEKLAGKIVTVNHRTSMVLSGGGIRTRGEVRHIAGSEGVPVSINVTSARVGEQGGTKGTRQGYTGMYSSKRRFTRKGFIKRGLYVRKSKMKDRSKR